MVDSVTVSRSSRAGHVIALVVTEGLPFFEFAVITEVFGLDRSDIVDPWYQLRLCALEPGQVRTGQGLATLDVPYGLAELERADTVLVAACHRERQVEPPESLLDALRRARRRGARIASVCTGAYLLAAAGLLDGRPATTHWMNAEDFASRYPEVRLRPDVLYTDDGDVLTSAGSAAGIDMCLHLVRRDHGAAVANEVARRMVVPPHRDGGQAQYVRFPVPAVTDDTLAPTLDWARGRLDSQLSVTDLARRAGMSPRTFARRFDAATGTSPLRWLLAERVALAQQLLETTTQSVEWIARRSGFGTAANLREHFRRAVSVPPQEYRRLFQARAEGDTRVAVPESVDSVGRSILVDATSRPGGRDVP